MIKSSTDAHWDTRALTEKKLERVNIADGVQRNLETDFLKKFLNKTDKILEVGCGNGYLSNQLRTLVQDVQAFDYSENMVEMAKKLHGEQNNRFYTDDVVHPKNTTGQYDAIVCVRVLINLQSLEEQVKALSNMAQSRYNDARTKIND